MLYVFRGTFFYCFAACLLFTAVKSRAQTTEIYTIPFTLEKRLLVFKGKINGVETDFAFDTGASHGVASNGIVKNTQLKLSNNTQRVNDSNGKNASVAIAKVDSFSVGGFTFTGKDCLVADMQYLACMNLFLLGEDVIRPLNWEIDFQKKQLRVSKTAFTTNGFMTVADLKYANNRPVINLIVEGRKFKDVLIDFGYTGVLTLPMRYSEVRDIVAKKLQQNKVNWSLSTSMGLLGTPKPDSSRSFLLDSVQINGTVFRNIPTECNREPDLKIGLKFLSTTCAKCIINNVDKKMYLLPKDTATAFGKTLSMAFQYQNKTLRVNVKPADDSELSRAFEIDEEIESINDRKARDFEDVCAYMQWFYGTRRETLSVKQKNGKVWTVGRTSW